LPGLTIENVRATLLTTWDAFLIFLLDKIVWMTPDVFVCNMNMPGMVVLELGANADTTSQRVYVTPDTAAAAATVTCDFLVRLLATCETDGVCIDGSYNSVPPPIYGAGISLFFQESREVVFEQSLCR
jgi:hypothetical protein